MVAAATLIVEAIQLGFDHLRARLNAREEQRRQARERKRAPKKRTQRRR
jgi:hypothetical protein